MSTDTHPPQLRDAAPATRYVYDVLRWADDPLTVQELIQRTGYSQRTIQRATDRLEEWGLVGDDWTLDEQPVRRWRTIHHSNE